MTRGGVDLMSFGVEAVEGNAPEGPPVVSANPPPDVPEYPEVGAGPANGNLTATAVTGDAPPCMTAHNHTRPVVIAVEIVISM